ncbi:MAG: polysaccharide deacetylase family protein [Deltaproteobacteria bacterium]|nr:polysaccharide deacetylase family protein [Deltaproteobacteria bacterium]
MRPIRILVLLLVIGVPCGVHSWGRIDDIRYKIKPSDGNLWASQLGRGYVVRGEERPGTITFTFDDGPDHRTTPVLLDQLDRYGIKAAFFINGARFHQRTAGGPENQAVLRDIYRRGHFLGNHTFNHKDITTLDEAGWRTEVFQVEQVIRGLIGRRPWIFRPPFGRADNKALERLGQEGYTVVMWNLDPLDWKAVNAADLLKRSKKVIEENPSGGVFLMHDTNRATVETFPLIVEWIEERNARLRAQGKQTLQIVGLEHYVKSKKRKKR